MHENIALVTGGAAGLGEVIAHTLAADGAHVLVADREPEAAADLIERLSGVGDGASFVETDASDPDQIRAMIDRAADWIGLPRAVIEYTQMTPQKQKQSGGLIDRRLWPPRSWNWPRIPTAPAVLSRYTRRSLRTPSILRRRLSPLVIESRQFLIRENLQHKVEDHDDTAGGWPRRPG